MASKTKEKQQQVYITEILLSISWDTGKLQLMRLTKCVSLAASSSCLTEPKKQDSQARRLTVH